MSRRKYMVLILGFMMLSLVLVYPILYLPRADVIRDRGVPVIQTSDHEPNRSLIIKELDVTVSMHPEEILELKRQSREFNEHYPNIVINIVDIPYPEAYKTLKNAGRIGESSDIMLLDNTWVNDFAASGLLKPADAVFNGEMLADQLNRLLQPLK